MKTKTPFLTPILFVLFALALSLGSTQNSQAESCCEEAAATCSPTGTCKACKNCKYCKNCSKNGGSCSVCKK